MTYVLRAPCTSTGDLQATYDVRWNVDIVGQAESTPTNTYLVTVGARGQGSTSTEWWILRPSLCASWWGTR